MLLPQASDTEHCQREDAAEHEPSSWASSDLLMFSWLLIPNLNPSAAAQEKAVGLPVLRSYSPATSSLRVGKLLLCDRRISGQALSLTVSCKTASTAATQHTPSISGSTVGTHLPKVKLTPFPSFLWTYIRGQQSPGKLTPPLPTWEDKQHWFPRT